MRTPSDQLARIQGENKFDHHKRLIYGKLVDKTLADVDYSELAHYVYGQDYCSDTTRRMMNGSVRTLQLLDQTRETGFSDSDSNGAISEIDAKMIELRKERQRLYDQRVEYTKAIRERARQEELNDIIIRSIQSGALRGLDPSPVVQMLPASDNDLLVSLNDIHYGASVSNYWREYNPDICRSMFKDYINRILSIAATHHSENCIVFANGDMISGNIHQQVAVSNKENVIEQMMNVSEIIADFIAELSKRFLEVRFVSVAGNHSRIEPKDRALQGERLDDLVEWYLKARLHEFTNVIIGWGEKIDSTMYTMNIRGKNYVGVHGDYDTNPTKIQSLQAMVGKPIYAILLGHLHHNQIDEVQGVKTIMAGSFLGMDDFCVSKRIYGKPEQMVCVCDDHGIRCAYDILFHEK